MPSYAGSAAVIRDGFKPLLLLYSVISDTSLYPPLFNPRISPANPSTFSDIIYRFLSSCLTWKNPHTRFNFTGVKDIWRNHHEIRKRNLQPASAPRRQQLLRGVPLHSLWCHPRYCQSGTAHLHFQRALRGNIRGISYIHRLCGTAISAPSSAPYGCMETVLFWTRSSASSWNRSLETAPS